MCLQVTAILVMYGLPRLLTGSILAHECMHAWFVLNYIDCSGKALNEGLSQLMALMWIEAQTGQVCLHTHNQKLPSRSFKHLTPAPPESLSLPPYLLYLGTVVALTDIEGAQLAVNPQHASKTTGSCCTVTLSSRQIMQHFSASHAEEKALLAILRHSHDVPSLGCLACGAM